MAELTAVPRPPDSSAAELSERLGYTFRDPGHLALAVTHRSFCAEHPGFVSNERLEFLGDAVLGVVVTDHIFRRYADMPEGELAKLRAAVVDEPTLAEVAGELRLGEAMRLGKGEDTSGGRHKASILSDALEAVFAAVYLDGGLEAVQPVIVGLLDERIVMAASGPGGHDYKTQLQVLAARHFEEEPQYDVHDEGPEHEKRFFATVRLRGEPMGAGEGRTKKQAEQAAAGVAWVRLQAELQPDEPGAAVALGLAPSPATDPAAQPDESEGIDA